MKNKLVTAYLFNLIDMVLVLFCYYIGINYVPRLFLYDVAAFVFFKIVMIGLSIVCTWRAYQLEKCSESGFHAKCNLWYYLYLFLIVCDVLLIVGDAL